MPIQRSNSEMGDLFAPEFFSNDFASLHEPIGDFGVWNGQFETGPDDRPEGWELPLTGGTRVCRRTTGGLAGNYCMMGGNTDVGTGSAILSLRYIPVDETRTYYLSAAFKSSAVTGTVNLGVYCFTAAKVWISTVLCVTGASPGIAWVRYDNTVGAGTATTFPAGTRYVRVYVFLQMTAALPGVYCYVDDIQFQQLRMATNAHTVDFFHANATPTASQLLAMNTATEFPAHKVNSDLTMTIAAGDPKTVLDIAGTPKFSLGVDDSDSDMFEICSGAAIGTTARLMITSAGLVGVGITPTVAFHVAGNAMLASSTYTASGNIADDTAISWTPGIGYGFIAVVYHGTAAYGGIAMFGTSAGGAFTYLIGGSNFNVTTGVLTGTTGADGKLTFSAHTNGLVYLENRLGGVAAFTRFVFA